MVDVQGVAKEDLTILRDEATRLGVGGGDWGAYRYWLTQQAIAIRAKRTEPLTTEAAR